MLFDLPAAQILLWVIAALSIALMLIRPAGIPEAIWVGAGAALLVALRLIPVRLAGHAVAEGLDVYLFLGGMMLLSELARDYGVFDWLANRAVLLAKGSRVRLFALMYCVGTLVTIFMSNDATAVVLTPAVLTAIRKAKAKPLPYLFICATIANAASFALPISNPANLVVFHHGIPALPRWLAMFALPSAASIAATYAGLRWYFRADLRGSCESTPDGTSLSPPGKLCLAGILGVAVVLLIASARNWNLGLPTCLAAVTVTAVVLAREKANPFRLAREIPWSILPLVAALFILVEAVYRAGALGGLEAALRLTRGHSPATASLAVGFAVGIGANLVNNLPLGLLSGAVLQAAHVHNGVASAVLLGVDLGPNLSITGSLATILWLIAIRREGFHVGGRQFFKAGVLIMPPALLLAIAASLLTKGP